eukprot:COSAG06_NODE_57251_length_281_cov_0.571429_1_plen_71_part_10
MEGPRVRVECRCRKAVGRIILEKKKTTVSLLFLWFSLLCQLCPPRLFLTMRAEKKNKKKDGGGGGGGGGGG